MSDPIVERIEREAGVPGLAAVLARLPPTDLRSLLLEVTRRRVAELEPRDVLRRWEEDRLARPAGADPGRLDELERLAFELLPPAFERARALPGRAARNERGARPRSRRTGSSRRRAAARSSATRPTCSRSSARCGAGATAAPRFASAPSHRLLRAQPFEPPFQQHFRLLALVSAGRAGSEEALLDEQLGFYLALLEPFGATAVDREPRKQAYYGGATFGVSVRGPRARRGRLRRLDAAPARRPQGAAAGQRDRPRPAEYDRRVDEEVSVATTEPKLRAGRLANIERSSRTTRPPPWTEPDPQPPRPRVLRQPRLALVRDALGARAAAPLGRRSRKTR